MTASVAIWSLTAALLFGLGLVLTQFGLRSFSPSQGATMSIPSATLLFVLLSPLLVDFAGWSLSGALIFAAAGVMFPSTVTLLTFESNRRIGPSLTGALGNLAPLFAVLMAFALLGEVPRSGQIAAIALILGGVLTLLWRPRLTPVTFALWVIALPLAAALLRGLTQPLVKLGLERWPDPFAAALIAYLVSTVVVLSFRSAKEGMPKLGVPRPQALWFVAVGMCNGLGALSMYAALARGPVAAVAPLVASYPLATVLFARLFLGVGLDRRTALGIVLTVAGVALLMRN
jgi:drug/metabolite transporter (DMT)-like permease